jgi:iron(III) transport system ATP-binding protein
LLRLEEMLEFIQLQHLVKRYPHELSGGQQQRVAFARALAPSPELLLMDEPFSSLDAHLKQDIREELKQLLRAANMTCLLVTHDQEDAAVICDRILQMTNRA